METEKEKKKKKKRQLVLLKEEEIVSEDFAELLKLLAELEKEGKIVDIQICPRCKSAKVKRVRTMEGDMTSHLTITPIKYECLNCGWRERLVLKATSKPLGLKEMALIAEALNIKEHAVQRAIQLSEDKYCSAGAMLKAKAKITSNYTIQQK